MKKVILREICFDLSIALPFYRHKKVKAKYSLDFSYFVYITNTQVIVDCSSDSNTLGYFWLHPIFTTGKLIKQLCTVHKCILEVRLNQNTFISIISWSIDCTYFFANTMTKKNYKSQWIWLCVYGKIILVWWLTWYRIKLYNKYFHKLVDN